jgi:hypothetical protein
MNTKLEYETSGQRFKFDLLECAVEQLERLKTMTCIMEAQLNEREPKLAELASNMADEIDGVVDRIEAIRD